MLVRKDLTDPRYLGTASVTSVGDWTDVALAGWTSVTSEAIPSTAVLASLSVTEKAGDAPCFVLFRAENGEATSAAWEVPANTTEAFDIFIPDAPIRTISVYGTARLKAAFYPGGAQ